MKIAVTGAGGKTGRSVLKDLLAHGHEVRAIDVAGAPGDRGDLAALGAPLLRADLTDFGETVEALTGVEAVVHLAAIPAPGYFTDARTLNDNNAMNVNVFLAAARIGAGRVVWTSSETTLGFPFGPDAPPRYLPVDEEHYPMPRSAYALSKVLGETMAEHVSSWSGIPFVALRLSNVHDPADYAAVPSYWKDPLTRVVNLWGYVDGRDAAQACRRALSAPVTGARAYNIAAADTLMDRPTAELVAEVFPGVPVRGPIEGHQGLARTDRARDELGYVPEYSWRDVLGATANRPPATPR
ncbi:UDP-glucose 4-epimerase [Sphaerisporangium melleum]|uniref:UDP-glucose 4-epimerase n=1 Tax=Sphaerisporangium melleum TaxID=321316 RepID=A0A917VUV0_9ACTN|nr:NAD(P)-dependent oxidoreductase [Sphaerisporangium melleum]GGL20325.1 UDP-glucose 4-epimerase [Sphaerisporangium melleum]GII74860.1 UDP-glucose 4-epimerase [Sphaerisporangium melleum]